MSIRRMFFFGSPQKSEQMAKGVTIEVQGLRGLQKKLGRLPQNLIHEVDAEMADVTNNYLNRAEAAAPIGPTGFLHGRLSAPKLAVMKYEIVSPMNYSAYVEFGTITRVKVPAELTAYAAQFKGRGLRKTGGMPARPFFFPQLPIARAELNKNLKNLMERAYK
jgi:hypothetical protein